MGTSASEHASVISGGMPPSWPIAMLLYKETLISLESIKATDKQKVMFTKWP